LEPPDTQEEIIRFGCGFIVGFFGIGVGSVMAALVSQDYILAVCLIPGIVCGIAAMKYGDRFWQRLSESSFWRWW
jgi:hypothetical protein